MLDRVSVTAVAHHLRSAPPTSRVLSAMNPPARQPQPPPREKQVAYRDALVPGGLDTEPPAVRFPLCEATLAKLGRHLGTGGCIHR